MGSILKKFNICLLLTANALIGTNLSSQDVDNRGWNDDTVTKMYFHYSEMQRQWAWELMGKQKLRGDENILDFGCGDGKISAELSHFVSGKVTGIDISAPMLSFASRKFPSYAYPNLEFKQTTSTTFDDIADLGNFDLICSFCVFHFVKNPVEILKNLKSHLNPSGKLLLVVPANGDNAFLQAGNEMFEKYQLEAPWKNSPCTNQMMMRTVEGCASFLQEAGYQILSIERVDTPNPYYSKEELINWMVGTVSANWNIPQSLAPQFFQEMVERMIELSPQMCDEQGCVHFQSPRIYVVAEI